MISKGHIGMHLVANIICVILLFCPLFAQEEKVIFYFPDSTISSIGTMNNDQLDGEWRSYFDNGQLRSIVHWKEDKLNGLSSFFSNEGLLSKTIDYKNGLKNGYIVHFDSLAQPIHKLPYVNDTLHGLAYTYYSNGQIKEECSYVNGKLQGSKRIFSEEDGRLIRLFVFDRDSLMSATTINQLNERNEKVGYWEERINAGTILREGHYIAGKENGLFRVYDQYGRLEREEEYLLGQLKEKKKFSGISFKEREIPELELTVKGPVKENKRVGVHRFYDKTGNEIYAEIYSNDTLLGRGTVTKEGVYESNWIFFYSDSSLKSEGFYKEGAKEGKWIFYSTNGTVTQKGTYRHNEPHGKWVWYYPNGQIRAEENYSRGKLEGEQVEYDSHGNVLTRGFFINGYEDGKWFYDVGDHKEVGNYVMGLREGLWIYYYTNGIIVFKGVYKDGKPIGKHKEWYGNGRIKLIERYKLGGVRHGRVKKYYEDGKLEHTLYYKNGILVNIDGKAVYQKAR